MDNTITKETAKNGIDSINSDIKKVRGAGSWSMILGYVLIIISGLYVWTEVTRNAVIGILVCFVLIGLYFVYSGKYIKDGLGKRIRGFLIVNGIISLPFCPGLVPIIVCVISFKNQSRYSKFPPKVKEFYTKSKGLKFTTKEVILIIASVVIAATSLGFRLANMSSSLRALSYGSVASQSSTYASKKHTFKIDFPGSPSTINSTTTSSGYTVPYTTYDSSVDNGSEEFDVYAYSWPTQHFDFTDISNNDMQTTLNDSLNGVVNYLHGTIKSKIFSTFLNHTSLDSTFTAPISGTNFTGYMRVFFIGNNQYNLLSLGSSKSDFNNFANSFVYTGN